jgi:outer membrane protein
MTEGVLNQVNSFIEEYSKNKGYDLVIGTTTSGNLLYAREYMDITDEVLKALNENYHVPTPGLATNNN